MIMVTGDHALTAEAIGRPVGIVTSANPVVIRCDQLSTMDDAPNPSACESLTPDRRGHARRLRGNGSRAHGSASVAAAYRSRAAIWKAGPDHNDDDLDRNEHDRDNGGGYPYAAQRRPAPVGERSIGCLRWLPRRGPHSRVRRQLAASTDCFGSAAVPLIVLASSPASGTPLSLPWATSIRRGLACSATGMVSMSTPSW